VVEPLRCLGYDGTSTGVSFEFEAGTGPAEYALGWVSCSGGPPTDRSITSASWERAQAVLQRIASGG